MARLWVGGLEVGISERDLEDEVIRGLARTSGTCSHIKAFHCEYVTICAMQFGRYGRLRSVWVARKVRLDVRFAAKTSGHYCGSLLTPVQFYGAASGIW